MQHIYWKSVTCSSKTDTISEISSSKLVRNECCVSFSKYDALLKLQPLNITHGFALILWCALPLSPVLALAAPSLLKNRLPGWIFAPEDGDSSLTLNWPSLVSFCRERVNRSVRAHAINQQDAGGGAALTGGVEAGASFASGGECSFMKATPYAMDCTQTRDKDSFTHLRSCVVRTGLESESWCVYLAVRLTAHEFHTVPFLLRRGLHQLAGPEETHAVCVCAVTTLCGRHEGRRDQQNLQKGESCINSTENDKIHRIRTRFIGQMCISTNELNSKECKKKK